MYYANWIKPIVNELDKRDFRAKFVTCVKFGGTVVLCSLVCFFEIGKKLMQGYCITWIFFV